MKSRTMLMQEMYNNYPNMQIKKEALPVTLTEFKSKTCKDCNALQKLDKGTCRLRHWQSLHAIIENSPFLY